MPYFPGNRKLHNLDQCARIKIIFFYHKLYLVQYFGLLIICMKRIVNSGPLSNNNVGLVNLASVALLHMEKMLSVPLNILSSVF